MKLPAERPVDELRSCRHKECAYPVESRLRRVRAPEFYMASWSIFTPTLQATS